MAAGLGKRVSRNCCGTCRVPQAGRIGSLLGDGEEILKRLHLRFAVALFAVDMCDLAGMVKIPGSPETAERTGDCRM